MKPYFFGDIHGKSVALEAVIQHWLQIRPDSIYCLDYLPSLPLSIETILKTCFPIWIRKGPTERC